MPRKNRHLLAALRGGLWKVVPSSPMFEPQTEKGETYTAHVAEKVEIVSFLVIPGIHQGFM